MKSIVCGAGVVGQSIAGSLAKEGLEVTVIDESGEAIKKTNSALNGKIAAVLTSDNEITLKTINIKNSKIHLIPANKNYNEKILNLNEVLIQGTLTGIIRKYN